MSEPKNEAIGIDCSASDNRNSTHVPKPYIGRHGPARKPGLHHFLSGAKYLRKKNSSTHPIKLPKKNNSTRIKTIFILITFSFYTFQRCGHFSVPAFPHFRLFFHKLNHKLNARLTKSVICSKESVWFTWSLYAAAPGIPFKYHATCFLASRIPVYSPFSAHKSDICRTTSSQIFSPAAGE